MNEEKYMMCDMQFKKKKFPTYCTTAFLNFWFFLLLLVSTTSSQLYGNVAREIYSE
jgi:hypothetical protein